VDDLTAKFIELEERMGMLNRMHTAQLRINRDPGVQVRQYNEQVDEEVETIVSRRCASLNKNVAHLLQENTLLKAGIQSLKSNVVRQTATELQMMNQNRHKASKIINSVRASGQQHHKQPVSPASKPSMQASGHHKQPVPPASKPSMQASGHDKQSIPPAPKPSMRASGQQHHKHSAPPASTSLSMQVPPSNQASAGSSARASGAQSNKRPVLPSQQHPTRRASMPAKSTLPNPSKKELLSRTLKDTMDRVKAASDAATAAYKQSLSDDSQEDNLIVLD
jgi:hypothetical protein